MASQRRMLQEINAGSMADIAFLLLVFFLVTTTMDNELGIQIKLPPPSEPKSSEVHDRNVMIVLANLKDDLLIEGKPAALSELRNLAKVHIQNKHNQDNLPERILVNKRIAEHQILLYKSKRDEFKLTTWENRLQAFHELGEYTTTKQIISLQNDRNTSYDMYIQVQNELAGAYHELRNELAYERFGLSYDQLVERGATAKVRALNTVYPKHISEADPY